VDTGFWWGNLSKGDHMEDPDIDGRIILIWIFKNWNGGHGLDLSGSRWGEVAGSCEFSN
jgi:hypothetical protein